MFAHIVDCRKGETCCEPDQGKTLAVEHWTTAHHESTGTASDDTFEGRFEFTRASGLRDHDLPPQSASCCQHIRKFCFGSWPVWVHQKPNDCYLRRQFMQQLDPFC